MASIEKTKTSSGAPRWIVRYDVHENGKRVQKKRSFATSKDAKDFASVTETAILQGRYTDSRGLTLGEYLTMWLTTYTTDIRPNSLRGYQNAIRIHIMPRLGGEPLATLSTAAIQKAYNAILQTEYRPAKYEMHGGLCVIVKPAKLYTPKTLRNIHAVLRMALEQARREGLIYRNPCDDTRLPSAKPIEYVIPAPEQLQALLTELRGAECYSVILTCALLACRRGEAAGLYWQDIDFDAGTIELKRALVVNNLKKVSCKMN